jgi:hypothetical protein
VVVTPLRLVGRAAHRELARRAPAELDACDLSLFPGPGAGERRAFWFVLLDVDRRGALVVPQEVEGAHVPVQEVPAAVVVDLLALPQRASRGTPASPAGISGTAGPSPLDGNLTFSHFDECSASAEGNAEGVLETRADWRRKKE